MIKNNNINLSLEIQGTECNGWPNLVIEFNKKVIHNNLIEDYKTINLELSDIKENNNELVLGMNNKKFGKDRIWDTISKDNKIIKDKTLKIIDCKLDDVSIIDILNKNLFRINLVDQQPSYYPTKVYSNGCMNYNGYFFISFDLPLYNSITNQKFKKEKNKSLSYFSNYTAIFHYNDEIEYIKKIEKKLEDIHERFSNKHS